MAETAKHPVAGVLYYIRPLRGVSGSRLYLSSNEAGSWIDLWSVDDNSGRQLWTFSDAGNGTYNISVFAGVTSKGKSLSCKGAQGVDLWTDDGSGRQRWTLEALDVTNAFRIAASAKDAANNKYLSCTADGTAVGRWGSDDGSGRQQWQLIPEDMEVVGTPVFHEKTTTLTLLPDFISTVTVKNDSETEQSVDVVFTRRASMLSRFEFKSGMEMKIGTKLSGELNAEVLKIGEEHEFSFTFSASSTYGQEQLREDTRTYEMPLKVPARTSLTAVATVRMGELVVPYTVKLKSKKSGAEVTSSGVWHVQAAGRLTYSVKPAT